MRFVGEGVEHLVALPYGLKGIWREIIALQGGELDFLVAQHEAGKPTPTFSALVGATKAQPVALPSDERRATSKVRSLPPSRSLTVACS